MNNPMSKTSNHVPIQDRHICSLVNIVVQHYIQNLIQSNIESLDVAEQKVATEFLNSTSERKIVSAATLRSLDLLDTYLNHPSQKTAVLLRQLFESAECSYTKLLTPHEIDDFWEKLLSFLLTHLLNKRKSDEHQDCDHYSYSENKTLDSDFFNPPSQMLSRREKELEEDNFHLRKKVKLLQIENKELLVELGQITVEKTAKENEKKRSEYFCHVFQSSLYEDKRSGAFNSKNNRSNSEVYQQSSDLKDSSGHLVTSRSPNPPILNEARALVQDNNLQPDNEKKVTNDEKDREFPGSKHEGALTAGVNGNQKAAMAQITPSIQFGEQLTAREETNQCRGNHDQASTSRSSDDDLSFSVQQHDSGRESISLSNIPPTSVATTLYNNYKFLLLSLAQRLLSSDVVKLQDWASQNFLINDPRNATDTLLQLDQNGVINASELQQLSDFFESIIRFDLVYIIHNFLLGDYSLLDQNPASKRQSANSVENSRHGSTSRQVNMELPSNYPTTTGVLQTSKYRNSVTKPKNSGASQNSVHPQHQEISERRDAVGIQGLPLSLNQGSGSLQVNRGGKKPPASTKPKNCAGAGNLVPQQTEQAPSRNSSEEVNANICNEIANEYSSSVHEEQNHYHAADRIGTNTTVDVDTAGHLHLSESLTNNARISHPSRSNISTTSTLQPSGTTERSSPYLQSSRASLNQELHRESNWLCSHFKRIGLVKFECCGKFWPCHHCHNNQRTCGQKKSHNAVIVKCVHCNTEQQFCQTCRTCGTKFANYYCERCKHLTGKDDFPYHCEKCETCRIHGDRSFHCDVCGLCFDNQYSQYHIHDKCCICLQDTFTWCPILPCSHKFHKECVNVETIHQKFIRCNICGKSFGSNYLTRSL